MSSAQEELRARTKTFALRIIKLYRSLPISPDAQILGKQLIRSGTSVAANHRAACRARSGQEFAARVGVVVEEADETVFWLELLSDSGLVKAARLNNLTKEARELTAIFTASYHIARARKAEVGPNDSDQNSPITARQGCRLPDYVLPDCPIIFVPVSTNDSPALCPCPSDTLWRLLP